LRYGNSLLQRIEKASSISTHITDSIHEAIDRKLNMSDGYIVSLILCGAVFALLVHFISISEIVNFLGFLPKPENNGTTTADKIFIKLIAPPDNPNAFAKLLIACSLAGFAERLVPVAACEHNHPKPANKPIFGLNCVPISATFGLV
jgi:hypothetical protein